MNSVSAVWVICMNAGLKTAWGTVICTSKVWSLISRHSTTGLSCWLPSRWETHAPCLSWWTVQFPVGRACSDHKSVCMIQRQIQSEEYGPKLSDVEKQIAAHNILHKEIEAYRSQVDSKVTLHITHNTADIPEYRDMTVPYKFRAFKNAYSGTPLSSRISASTKINITEPVLLHTSVWACFKLQVCQKCALPYPLLMPNNSLHYWQLTIKTCALFHSLIKLHMWPSMLLNRNTTIISI